MISSKILCTRPRRSLCEEVQEETQRRKKSGGQLYVNGYRVRQGPGHSRELEGDGLLCSLYAYLRVLGGWGKRDAGSHLAPELVWEGDHLCLMA